MSASRTIVAGHARSAVLFLVDTLALEEHCPELVPVLWRRLAESQIDWTLEEVEALARKYRLMEDR